MQPASKPAAPRLHKTVASTRLCQGRSAGKGLARGGEGRLFSRPCNFPRSRLAGPVGVGRGPGPSQGHRAAPQDGGGEWESAQPARRFLFSFLFSPPCPFLSHFLSGRGRGPEREGKAEEGTGDIPVLQACWVRVPARHSHQTTWLWVRLAGGSRAGSENQRLASVSPCAPLPMETGHPYFGFKCVCIHEMSASNARPLL